MTTNPNPDDVEVSPSNPTSAETAGSLRLAAIATYVVVLFAAYSTTDPAFAVILTAAIPVVVALVLVAETISKGGRVR